MVMKNNLQTCARISSSQLADGLRRNLQNKYGNILGRAGKHWDRKFAGKEPSDACVRVRISGKSSASERFCSARQRYASLAA